VPDPGKTIAEDPPETEIWHVEGTATASASPNASPISDSARAQITITATDSSGGTPQVVEVAAEYTHPGTIPPPPGDSDAESFAWDLVLDGPAPVVELVYEGSAHSSGFGALGRIQVQRNPPAKRIQRVKIVAPTDPVTTASVGQVTHWEVNWQTNVAGAPGAQPDGMHRYRIRIQAKDSSNNVFGGARLTNTMSATDTVPLPGLPAGTYSVQAFLDISDGSQWHTKAGSKEVRTRVVR
jgi:hypothetical protein